MVGVLSSPRTRRPIPGVRLSRESDSRETRNVRRGTNGVGVSVGLSSRSQNLYCCTPVSFRRPLRRGAWGLRRGRTDGLDEVEQAISGLEETEERPRPVLTHEPLRIPPVSFLLVTGSSSRTGLPWNPRSSLSRGTRKGQGGMIISVEVFKRGPVTVCFGPSSAS